ncbi:hypothetical protein E2C01_057920 [Portunus trituberculatus]|uniref:Uncharacterized protein n=1 Tax=Portunus trituberculatus TaxID=210409 RepID=A0A5B7H4N5_PORTR|nr:hypothetical protein [Portunus trituberculatus]
MPPLCVTLPYPTQATSCPQQAPRYIPSQPSPPYHLPFQHSDTLNSLLPNF